MQKWSASLVRMTDAAEVTELGEVRELGVLGGDRATTGLVQSGYRQNPSSGHRDIQYIVRNIEQAFHPGFLQMSGSDRLNVMC